MIFCTLFYWALGLWPGTSLQVTISGIEKAQGQIHLAVFDNATAFDEQKPACFSKVLSANGSSSKLVLDIPVQSGKNYAIAVYHDVNNNGELDTNMMGIPQEPYGFSNNPAAKWKAPGFQETVFSAGPSTPNVQIVLKRWSQR